MKAISRLRRIPFTLCMVLSILLLAYHFGSLQGSLAPIVEQRWGVGLHQLWDGRPYTLITSVFLTRRPFMVLGMVVVVGGIMGLYEWLVGWRRAALLYWSTDLAAKLATMMLVVLPLDRAGTALGHSLAACSDIGASVGGTGCLGALLHYVPTRYRRLAIVVTLLYHIGRPLVYPDPCADVAHTFALGIGWWLGGRFQNSANYVGADDDPT
ncbi:MAG: hypothetical protein R2867_13760 [Caldilineaceae bacterium]